MLSQCSLAQPHAGQLRYHDFSKLRELHHKRLAAAAAAAAARTIPGSVRVSFCTTPRSVAASAMQQLPPQGQRRQQSRSFFTTTAPFSNWRLREAQRRADDHPESAAAQYEFLSQLQRNHPQAVVDRMRLPAYKHCAVNPAVAVLYLQALQQTGSLQYLDANDLLSRLQQHAANGGSDSGAEHDFASLVGFGGSSSLQQQQIQNSAPYLSPSQIQSMRDAMQHAKLSKREQAAWLFEFFQTGFLPAAATATATATATAAASMGAAATAAGSLAATAPAAVAPVQLGGTGGGNPSAAAGGWWSSNTATIGNNDNNRGMNPKNPLYVRVTKNPGSWQGRLLVGLGKVGMVLVWASFVGALVEEKGLGRGMGLSSGSKHINEAAAEEQKVKFDDVKGVAEAKAELEEIVHYLRDPSKFTRLGGKLPRGLLLTGPPGTGKTLLAKAIAGEADVPFFYSSGSQFEEVYVGLGAKRIRELFQVAKKKAPAIIFIDEIDAVGGTRKLKDQSALKMTLNELLVQLDGFDENNGIIVIGATNFPESLDKALLRPGRFDKHVTVPLPDVGGRKEILEMYAAKTVLGPDVDLSVLAKGTTGFSGADLYNLMNQAALKASVDGLHHITMSVMEYAKDKILMGAERKSAVITAKTAKCTAYHEAGHAVVAVLTPGAQTIHKATIMPRGNALGMVSLLPEGDQTSQSFKELVAFMDVAMGGRVAEELIFGSAEVTSGAASDIQNASQIARAMVTQYGFSENVGIVNHGRDESASQSTKSTIDAEVKRLTDAAYKRAKDLLVKHSAEHKLLAETLLEYETLSGDEVRDLVLKKKKPSRPVINKVGGARGDTSVLDNGKKKATSTSRGGRARMSAQMDKSAESDRRR